MVRRSIALLAWKLICFNRSSKGLPAPQADGFTVTQINMATGTCWPTALSLPKSTSA